jgi:ribosomal protein L40E
MRLPLFSILLLSFAVIPLAGSGYYSSQPFDLTTVTSLQTYTTTVTSASYGVYSAGVTYITSTQKGTLYSGPIPITPTESNYECIYDNLPFTVKRGDHITGQLSSNSSVSFYIMSEDQFKTWLNRRRCPVVSAWISKEGIISYEIDWTVPQDGQYEFLFLNFSPQKTANVEFDVSLAGSLSVTVLTSTVYSSTTQMFTSTFTGTLTSVSTQQVQNPSPVPYVWVVAAVIAAVVAIVAVALYRRRSRPAVPSPAATSRAPSEMFCRKCGAKIPRDSTFCLECGTKVV